MSLKYCPNKSRPSSLTINNLDHQNNFSSNFVLTKQNCMTLSNQNQSLLVSSLQASSSNVSSSNRKPQKRLNSEFVVGSKINNQYPKHNIDYQKLEKGVLNHNSQNKQFSHNFNKNLSQNSSKQLLQLKQKTLKNQRKIQQLQALIKICFAKNVSLQNIINQKDKQIQLIKSKLQQNQKMLKKAQSIWTKEIAKKDVQQKQNKTSVMKISDKLAQKTNELNDIIQLQKNILDQKISKLSYFYEQKFQSLIDMVQQVTKIQQKMNKTIKQKQKQHAFNLIKFDSFSGKQNALFFNGHKRSSSENKGNGTILNSNKARNQQKSKISYYLSKSNFNQTTNISDMSINQFSRIG